MSSSSKAGNFSARQNCKQVLAHSAQSLVTITLRFFFSTSMFQNIFTNLPTGGGLTMSLKLTENTACFSAARKKLFREVAASAARIVYKELAARRRSLAPVR